jgi:hypothetical protein
MSQRVGSLSVVLGFVLLAGCWTSFHGQRPITPGVGDTVDTLQPTLRWEPSEEPGVTYDVRVQANLSSETFRDANDIPFLREGLREPFCKIEPALKPGREYLWAVRVRRGDEITAWSSYDRSYYALLLWGTTHGIRYSFLTPHAASVSANPPAALAPAVSPGGMSAH